MIRSDCIGQIENQFAPLTLVPGKEAVRRFKIKTGDPLMAARPRPKSSPLIVFDFITRKLLGINERIHTSFWDLQDYLNNWFEKTKKVACATHPDIILLIVGQSTDAIQ